MPANAKNRWAAGRISRDDNQHTLRIRFVTLAPGNRGEVRQARPCGILALSLG